MLLLLLLFLWASCLDRHLWLLIVHAGKWIGTEARASARSRRLFGHTYTGLYLIKAKIEKCIIFRRVVLDCYLLSGLWLLLQAIYVQITK